MRGLRRYYIGFSVTFPTAVRRIIALTVLAYVFQVITGHRWDTLFGLVPHLVVSAGALWQVLTYALQHASPFHLLWNMLVLWMLGSDVEVTWGSRRFVAYYLLCTVGAAAATIALSPQSQTVTIGASGAVFGILAAFAVLFPDRHILFMFLFPLRARYFVLVLAGLQLLLFAEGRGGVAYAAHLGGLLTGAAYLVVVSGRLPRILPRLRRRPRLVVVPRPPQPPPPLDPREIDRILDRISEVGLEGLTPYERATLEQASKVFERKDPDA